ncbi:MAG: hypothetical protein CL525_12525 [Aequorivita sp.]|nr:hypothetical protein [Aequorivita sp.]
MIHQIFWPFKGKELCDIPNFKLNVDETIEFCKVHNYDYKLWNLEDCENLIKEDFNEYWQLWQDFRYDIQRCDFIRYCILYKFGGLYLDCDIRPMKNLAAVFSEPIYFVHWADDKNKKPYNAVMHSSKNHNLFLEIIKQCKEDFYEKCEIKTYETWKGRFVFQTTGHSMLERVTKKQKINKDKYFHNVLYIKNYDKGFDIGNCDNALFYDANASVWYDNLI